MQHFSYSRVPTVAQFQKDSSVTLAVRNKDIILTHLDWLLERLAALESDFSMRRIVLVDLFLTSNYWIRLYHERNPNILKERYPSVLALFESVVNELRHLLGCSAGQVAALVEEMYGRDITREGVSTDRSKGAIYFDRIRREECRIRFRNGIAHRVATEQNPVRLVPIDSDIFYMAVARHGMGETFPGWAPFVMTLERAFYMTKHVFDSGRNSDNMFHSVYFGRDVPVACAGTMLIEKGVIRGIRPDSGHYKPLAHNVVGVLQALGMLQVPLQQIRVYHFSGQWRTPALSFMTKRLTWGHFLLAADDLQKKRGTGASQQQATAVPPGRGAPPRAAPTPAVVTGGGAVDIEEVVLPYNA